MGLFGLSFSFSDRQFVARLRCLLNHFHILGVMNLNQYLIALENLVLVNEHRFLMIYIRLTVLFAVCPDCSVL